MKTKNAFCEECRNFTACKIEERETTRKLKETNLTLPQLTQWDS